MFEFPPFPPTWAWEITGFPTELFQWGPSGIGWKLQGTEPGGLPNVPFWHQHTKLHICHGVRYATDGIDWFIASWRKIHWFDESRFLLHVTGVWRQPNVTYTTSNIQETIPYGGGSVMVWWCVWSWSQFKAILMGQDINGTSWNPLVTWTTMLWPWDQCLHTIILDPTEYVQWWISYNVRSNVWSRAWEVVGGVTPDVLTFQTIASLIVNLPTYSPKFEYYFPCKITH